jgi:hypothetical protein
MYNQLVMGIICPFKTAMSAWGPSSQQVLKKIRMGRTKWGPQTIAKLVYNFNNYGFYGTYNYSYCDL